MWGGKGSAGGVDMEGQRSKWRGNRWNRGWRSRGRGNWGGGEANWWGNYTIGWGIRGIKGVSGGRWKGVKIKGEEIKIGGG